MNASYKFVSRKQVGLYFYVYFTIVYHPILSLLIALKNKGCISNCRHRILSLGKHNTWLAKSFIMQGHYDHKGGTPDSYREITT